MGVNSQNFFSPDVEPKRSKGSKKKTMKNMKINKDYGLSIFHALGKFLYNKRIDPKTKKARIMNSDELLVHPKPKSYINHGEILSKVRTENHIFSIYLHENAHDMFNDIEDLSKVLEVYSHNDMISTVQDYSYANTKYYDEVRDHWSLSEALAVTEYNIHGGDNKERNRMKKFVKPQWFDLQRKIRENKTIIFDTTRVDQIRSKQILSEGLLTASLSKIAWEYLPYLKRMGLLQKYEVLSPLIDIKGLENVSLTQKQIGNEEDFNDKKEQAFVQNEEEKKREQQKLHRRKNHADGLATIGKIEPKSNYPEEEISDSDDEINEEDLKDILEDLLSDSE